jgi:hypothetical protein
MHEIDARETLAVLHRTRASLETGPFTFHDWTQCTCGHLYVGATGSAAARRAEVRSPRPDGAYASVLVAVARALSRDEGRFAATRRRWYDRRSPAAMAARWISDYTMRRARRDLDVVKRADAIAVVDEAIALVAAQAAAAQPADVHERPLPA